MHKLPAHISHPVNVWREGDGSVWIACTGCGRRLRLQVLPAGREQCPDCRELHDYNIEGRKIPFRASAPDRSLARYLRRREIAVMTVEILAATETLGSAEIRFLLDAIAREIIRLRREA